MNKVSLVLKSFIIHLTFRDSYDDPYPIFKDSTRII